MQNLRKNCRVIKKIQYFAQMFQFYTAKAGIIIVFCIFAGYEPSYCTQLLAPPSLVDVVGELSKDSGLEQNFFYMKHISDNQQAVSEVDKRFERVMNFIELSAFIKSELKKIRDYRRLKLTDEQINNCTIVLFGSYLWHSKKDKPKDIDVIILIDDSEIDISGFVIKSYNSAFPSVDYCLIRGFDSPAFRTASGVENKIVNFLLLGSGKVICGDQNKLKEKIRLKLTDSDIAEYANSLISKARNEILFYHSGIEDISTRKIWKLLFDSYIYLQPLMSEYGMRHEAIRFEQNFLGRPLAEYMQKYILGDLRYLPWEEGSGISNLSVICMQLAGYAKTIQSQNMAANFINASCPRACPVNTENLRPKCETFM